MHRLLTQAGITGSTVLMGHSIAGLYIRAYLNRYPHNVSGLVFVDSSTPLQEDRFPADPEDTKNPELELLELKWLYILGIPRVMGQCTHEAGFDDHAGRMIAEDQCRPSLWTTIGQEEKSGRQSGNETIHTGPFGDLPILIFSEDPQLSVSSALPAKPEIEMAKIWNEMQEDLKHLSTRSRRIIAKSSSHYIQVDRPDLLNQNVARFIQQIRGESLQPTDYGSTKTE